MFKAWLFPHVPHTRSLSHAHNITLAQLNHSLPLLRGGHCLQIFIINANEIWEE